MTKSKWRVTSQMKPPMYNMSISSFPSSSTFTLSHFWPFFVVTQLIKALIIIILPVHLHSVRIWVWIWIQRKSLLISTVLVSAVAYQCVSLRAGLVGHGRGTYGHSHINQPITNNLKANKKKKQITATQFDYDIDWSSLSFLIGSWFCSDNIQ